VGEDRTYDIDVAVSSMRLSFVIQRYCVLSQNGARYV